MNQTSPISTDVKNANAILSALAEVLLELPEDALPSAERRDLDQQATSSTCDLIYRRTPAAPLPPHDC